MTASANRTAQIDQALLDMRSKTNSSNVWSQLFPMSLLCPQCFSHWMGAETYLQRRFVGWLVGWSRA